MKRDNMTFDVNISLSNSTFSRYNVKENFSK